MLAPASSIILTFLMCRTLLALRCEDSGTCDDSTPRFSNKRDLSHELRRARPVFRKTSTESPPKNDLKSQYESLLKSIKEIQDLLKQSQKSAKIPTNGLEEVDDHEHKPAIDRGECSAWAMTNAAALIRASKFGNTRRIASLLFIGTPVDAVDETGGGRTPLHWAVSKGKVAAAKQLLERGASVNRPVPGISDTPLHIAASTGDLEMVKLLVDYGADITALNSRCFTPLEVSKLHDRHEVSQWLQENAEKYTVCKEKRALNKKVPPRHEFTSARVLSKGVSLEDEPTPVRVLNRRVPPQYESTSARVLSKQVPHRHRSTSARPSSSHATSTPASPLANSTTALTTLTTRH